jgi:hypothetical protein
VRIVSDEDAYRRMRLNTPTVRITGGPGTTSNTEGIRVSGNPHYGFDVVGSSDNTVFRGTSMPYVTFDEVVPFQLPDHAPPQPPEEEP